MYVLGLPQPHRVRSRGDVSRLALIALLVVAGLSWIQGRVSPATPAPVPVWERSLAESWTLDGREVELLGICRDHLGRYFREGSRISLIELDRTLNHAASTAPLDRGHPLARVDAWRDLVAELLPARKRPDPGLRTVTWPSERRGSGEVRAAILVPDDLPDSGDLPVIVTIPDDGETPREHLERHWKGLAHGVLLIAPERSAETRRRPGRLLLALGRARREWALDEDRIFVAGLTGAASVAERLAASFTDRFAGRIVGKGKRSEFATRSNLDAIPVLRIDPGEVDNRVAQWMATGADGAEIRRDPFPIEIDWTVSERRTEDRAWWILITRLEPGAFAGTIHARIVPPSTDAPLDGHRIEITTEGIADFRVLLNDRMVNLDRLVMFVVNGRVIPHPAHRSVRVLVDRLEDLGDRSAIFTAQKNLP